MRIWFFKHNIKKPYDCGLKKRNLTVIEIDFEELASHGIESLQDCVFFPQVKSKSTVHAATKVLKVHTPIFGDVVFVDLQPMETQGEKIDFPISISMIPKLIVVGNEQFLLKAVIEYQQNAAHYVAHCYKAEKLLLYNDLFEEIIRTDANKIIQVHMLAFVRASPN